MAIAAAMRLQGRRYLGLIRDLSPTGAFIELMDRDPFPHEGRGVLMCAALGSHVDVEIRSKRHDRGGHVLGLGVEFVDTPEAARENLRRVIADALAKPPGA